MLFFETLAKLGGKGKIPTTPLAGESQALEKAIPPRQSRSDLGVLRQFRDLRDSAPRLTQARKLALADAETAKTLLQALPAPAPREGIQPPPNSPGSNEQTNFKTSFGLANRPSFRNLQKP